MMVPLGDTIVEVGDANAMLSRLPNGREDMPVDDIAGGVPTSSGLVIVPGKGA